MRVRTLMLNSPLFRTFFPSHKVASGRLFCCP
nr:MAG TPA: wound-inducible basic protein family protein [Caudoviricetes sp.]DAO31962.1 MAG TPA: wound-inducible basic protein family protein [Caudoviricetes sp.]DAY74349.1 MAG TPA: wound-inducible basic protein family protein [Caudoviricetes sp.]